MTDQSSASDPKLVSQPDVVALRPFVPASDFEASVNFYRDLGFTIRPLGDSLAAVDLGPFGFLLQKFQAEGYANNYMMHLTVNDLDAWWQRIDSLDLATKYDVRPPTPPELQPWGLTISYVVDPSGILWHFAQNLD
jgi:catechol 2,3-dioxygenase-like lactoylglutathione lyase family enzyme